jgi:hydrogenase maturation protease
VKTTLVLGLGNILLADEGVGVRVIQRLQALYRFPEETQVMDGGTLGLDLLPYVEDTDRLVVVDAVDMRAEPGTVVRIENEEVPTFLSIKVSPHQMGLADILSAARLLGRCPKDLVLWGIQPGVIKAALELSPPVGAQVDILVDGVLADLSRWGIEPTRRLDHERETVWLAR